MPRMIEPSVVPRTAASSAGPKHLADFQAAAGAHDDTACAWIGYGVDGGKPADVTHQTDSYEMVARHIDILGHDVLRAKPISRLKSAAFAFPRHDFPAILFES